MPSIDKEILNSVYFFMKLIDYAILAQIFTIVRNCVNKLRAYKISYT